MTLATGGADTGVLAGGVPDVRGWPARTLVDDRIAATVEGFLVSEAGLLRWLVLEVGGGRRVLLPGGQARADREGAQIRLPGLAADQVPLLPAYDPAAELDDAAEETLLAAYTAVLLREPVLPPPAEPEGDVAPLALLPELRVASGEPDPRGWDLIGAADTPLGRISELLVDTRAMKVRHLVCRLPGNAGREFLLPIGYAHLDTRARAVRVRRLTAEALQDLPPWSDPTEVGRAAAATAARLGAARTVAEDPRLDASLLFPEAP
jgi:hypothetical protein